MKGFFPKITQNEEGKKNYESLAHKTFTILFEGRTIKIFFLYPNYNPYVMTIKNRIFCVSQILSSAVFFSVCNECYFSLRKEFSKLSGSSKAYEVANCSCPSLTYSPP